jgi:peptide deformylase
MIAKVLIYDSSILRKHSAQVLSNDNVTELAKTLFDTLLKEGGIGLAAPQIGVLKRVFVIDTTPLNEEDETTERIKHIVINPQIISLSNEASTYSEGCLSIPGIFEEVERPEGLRVKYQDELLNPIEKEIHGIEARVFQHEYDHLEGILFVDKVSPIRRRMLESKLKRIARSANK